VTRINLDFNSLSAVEQDWYLQETWCDVCEKADLGILEPELYMENNQKYVGGKCRVCGTKCVSSIIEKDVEG